MKNGYKYKKCYCGFIKKILRRYALSCPDINIAQTEILKHHHQDKRKIYLFLTDTDFTASKCIKHEYNNCFESL